MKVSIFQHEPGEHAGLFEQLFRDWGVEYRYVHLFETHELPLVDATHLLIMGGSMSVHDEWEYEFLKEEKKLIRDWICEHRPLLGICLGAQLIAHALGGRVGKCPQEIGWVPLSRTSGDTHHLFPDKFFSFQLHSETFEIPEGGALLCTGNRVMNQAFSYHSAIGLQFHPEVTPAMIHDWTGHLPLDEKKKIEAGSANHLVTNLALCRNIITRFLHSL